MYKRQVYEPCERRPVCAFADGASWIYQGSFSKSFAPGLRLGYLAASEDLFEPLMRLKQAADLHSNRLSQWLVLQYLQAPNRRERLAKVAQGYAAKRDRFAEQLQRHLGNRVTWTTPPGGLFFWVELQAHVDAQALFEAALRRGVLFTPGDHFRVEPGPPAMRLNFSLAEPDAAERGLAVLGELLA